MINLCVSSASLVSATFTIRVEIYVEEEGQLRLSKGFQALQELEPSKGLKPLEGCSITPISAYTDGHPINEDHRP